MGLDMGNYDMTVMTGVMPMPMMTIITIHRGGGEDRREGKVATGVPRENTQDSEEAGVCGRGLRGLARCGKCTRNTPQSPAPPNGIQSRVQHEIERTLTAHALLLPENTGRPLKKTCRE